MCSIGTTFCCPPILLIQISPICQPEKVNSSRITLHVHEFRPLVAICYWLFCHWRYSSFRSILRLCFSISSKLETAGRLGSSQSPEEDWLRERSLSYFTSGFRSLVFTRLTNQYTYPSIMVCNLVFSTAHL